ncbi:MAG: hypothetical protein RL372_393 [Bacteroidota bacterium]|jgi:hypothetical protein
MKKIYSISVITSLLFMASCSKDFLDVKPQQSVLTEDVFNSMATSRAAVNGLYSMMQSYSYYGRDAMVIPEVLSDNATRSVKSGNRYTGMNTVTHTATDANVSRMWSQMYQIVTNANAIIANEANIKKVATSLEQEEAAQLVGEAYAVRALVYFDLMKFFARPLKFTADGSHLGVPLVIKPIVNITEVIYPARNTAAEVYAQIDKDIASAIALLPQNGNVISNGVVSNGLFKIRMNRFSTLALKARVAVYASDWTAAADAANQVIASGRYALYTYGTMLQDFKTQNSAESLFEVANNTNDNPGTDSYAYLCSQQGYGEMLGTRNSMNSKSTGTTLSTFKGLYEAYSATDVRRGFVALGDRNSLGGETNVPIPTKYTNISNYMENIKVMRLAEMYLIRGEANARLAVANSNTSLLTTSLTDINLIRKNRDTASATKPFNAVLTGTPPTGSISATAYLDSIIVERRKEFAFEGQRLFDLNRTQTNFVKISSGGNATSRLIQYTATTSSYYYRTLLPIPVSQVQNNKNMVQNPGF